MKKTFFYLLILIIIIIIYCLFKNYKLEQFESKKIKIGIIIPSRVNKCEKLEDFIFMNTMMPSYIKNMNNKDYEHNFYIGYDHNDKCWQKFKNKIKKYFKKNNLNINYFVFNKSYKGHVSKMWSKLAELAVNDNNEYLYQLGDDIKIIDSNWESKFIDKLKSQNNIGVVGPLDTNNNKILTQSFVHKTHLQIFKTYFPKTIKNWFIDDWITKVYEDKMYKFENIKIHNSGGDERYTGIDNKPLYMKELKKGKGILKKYLNK